MFFLLFVVGVCRDFAIFVDSNARMVLCSRSAMFNNNNERLMEAVKLGKHSVKLYDCIEDLPIVRFHKYQKYLLVDSGIGGTIAQFDQRIETIRRFLMLEKVDKAQKEIENLRQCVYMIQSEISPRHLSFAALITEIDGKPCDDLSDDALQKVIEQLSDVPESEITDLIGSVKKKIDRELVTYFPALFDNSEVKEYYGLMKKRIVTILENITKGVDMPDRTKEVQNITTKLITYSNPQTFSGSDSAEIRFDKEFENLCLLLSGELNVKPKDFSVLEFYNAFTYLQDRAKRAEKAQKRTK